MKTCDDVRELALYASDCCGEELIFDKEDCFSRCPHCQRLCEWELVENLIPYLEMELVVEEQAA